MKKFIKKLLCAVLIVPMLFLITACNDDPTKTVVGFELSGNQYIQYVEKGTEVNQLSIKPIYDDGTKGDEVALSSNMISGYNKDKVGTQRITITYEGSTKSADIFVANRKVEVSNVNALYTAINNQEEGDFILLANGNYNIDYTNYSTTKSLSIFDTDYAYSDFYMLVYKNHVKVAGSGDTNLYSSIYEPNGNWNYQNFITVAGEDVTLDNLNIVSKTEVNKVIEMVENGKDFRLTNTTISAPTDTTTYGSNAEKFAGSVYFNVENIGNVVFKNVTLNGGRLSFTGAKQGNVSFENTLIDYIDCDEWIYEYGAIFGPVGAFYGNDKTLTTTAANELTVNFDASKYTSADVLNEVKEALPEGTTVVVINEA